MAATSSASHMAEDGDDDDEYQPSERHIARQASSSKDEVVHLAIPGRDLLRATTDVSTRCKMTLRQAVAFTASLVRRIPQ